MRSHASMQISPRCEPLLQRSRAKSPFPVLCSSLPPESLCLGSAPSFLCSGCAVPFSSVFTDVTDPRASAALSNSMRQFRTKCLLSTAADRCALTAYRATGACFESPRRVRLMSTYYVIRAAAASPCVYATTRLELVTVGSLFDHDIRIKTSPFSPKGVFRCWVSVWKQRCRCV